MVRKRRGWERFKVIWVFALMSVSMPHAHCLDVTGKQGLKFSCQVLCVVSCDGLWDLAQVLRAESDIPNLAYDHIVFDLIEKLYPNLHPWCCIDGIIAWYGARRRTSSRSPLTREPCRHDSRRKNRGKPIEAPRHSARTTQRDLKRLYIPLR